MNFKEEYGDLQLKKEALLFQVRDIEQRQRQIKIDMASENKKGTGCTSQTAKNPQ
jgi:hypothetical protein